MSALDALWRIEHHGPGPVVAIVHAATASAAIEAFRDHLESYEGCYRNTGWQEVSRLEFEPGGESIVCVALRPF